MAVVKRILAAAFVFFAYEGLDWIEAGAADRPLLHGERQVDGALRLRDGLRDLRAVAQAGYA